MALDRVQDSILYSHFSSNGLEPMSPALRRLDTRRDKFVLLQPVAQSVRHLLCMIDKFGRFCGIVKEQTVRGAFQIIKKAQCYDLAMQGNVPPLARFVLPASGVVRAT